METPRKKKLPFVFLIIGILAAIFVIPMLIDNIRVSTRADYVVIAIVVAVGVLSYFYFTKWRNR